MIFRSAVPSFIDRERIGSQRRRCVESIVAFTGCRPWYFGRCCFTITAELRLFSNLTVQAVFVSDENTTQVLSIVGAHTQKNNLRSEKPNVPSFRQKKILSSFSLE